MDEAPKDQAGLPRDLRFLKTLVTVLTGVMIAGVITITALLVIRLNDTAEAPILTVAPGEYAVPEGVGVTGFQLVGRHVVIIGDDNVIRVFERDSGLQVRVFALPEG
ncbi:DUF6476 family protein [Roseicyclus elongatus]|nr:DUF6476 family protein [Roseibacterium elongatum]